MKKITVLVLVMAGFMSLNAQDQFKKQPALGFHFFLNDFETAQEIRTNGLVNVLSKNDWKNTSRMSPGFALSYLQGLSNHVDFVGTASGSFVDYPYSNIPTTGDKSFLLELAGTVNLKMTTDQHVVSPFLTLGAGISKYKGYYGAFIPMGLGVQFNLWNEAFILVNSQYRISVTEGTSYHFYHSVGVAGSLFKKKEIVIAPLPAPVVAIPEPPRDSDKDGVVDSLDACPDQAGPASLQGCPDKDGDGIVDGKDKCPDQAGLARYEGCPIPDTDKDGINDENDKCVTEAGLARYQGCPIPDTDKDGVNDEEDKCPAEVGTISNFGCPEIAQAVIEKINLAAKNIFFAPGSAKLLPKSFKSLNEVVKILNDNPSYQLDIDGHTDNSGKADKNQALSESRAKAVLAYIASKGIVETRLNAAGYGADKPIADNKTAKGKAQNRRVEIKARNY